MKRALLVIGAVAVFAAALILWLALRDDPSTPTTVTKSEPVSPQPRAADPAPSIRPTVSDSDKPRSVQAQADEPREYVVGDVEIRDHRTGNHAPIDLPPNIHKPTTHRVSSALVNEVSDKIQAVMTECTAKLPPEARGSKPRLEGVVYIAIKNKEARVTEATMQLRDVTGASVDPTKACIQEKSVGITTSAADEPDLEKYSISLSFAVL